MTDISGAAGSVPFGRVLEYRSGTLRSAGRAGTSLRRRHAFVAMARRCGRGLGALAVVAALAAAVAIGAGWVKPVVTVGSSMEPTYRAGDLVVVVGSTSYDVGDIVAYDSDAYETTVLHRIVGGDADGFELQGDNNTSIDPSTPRADELIGRAVLHIPRLGSVAQSASSVLGGLVAIVLIGIGTVVLSKPKRSQRRADTRLRRLQRSRPHHRAGTGARAAERPGAPPSRLLRTALVVCVLADVVVAIALVASFVFTPQTGVAAAAPEQTGSLRYGADVVEGVTYPSGRIVTGDPVFTRLTDRLDVSFTYDSTATEAITGSAALWIQLASTSGWVRTVTLDEAALGNGPVELNGTLDLTTTADVLSSLSAETGIQTAASSITVGATVTPIVDGTAGSVSETEMRFGVSDVALTLETTEALVDGDGDPAVVSTSPMLSEVAAPTVGDGIPPEWRRWLLVALLASVSATAMVWPTRTPAATVVSVSELRLSTQVTRIRMNDTMALDEIAEHEMSPVLEGDGWRAVIADQRLYWDGDREPETSSA